MRDKEGTFIKMREEYSVSISSLKINTFSWLVMKIQVSVVF